MKGRSGVGLFELTANPRFLASFRIAVGGLVFTKGAALLYSGANPAIIVPWMALALCLGLGWRARWAAVAMLVLGGWVVVEYYRNHLYLLWLLVLLTSFSDCERHYALRRAGSGSTPGWPVFLMRWQLSLVYVWAAVGKVNAEFLQGDVLAYYFERSIFPLAELAADTVVVPLAVATIALELFVGLALWSPRTRTLAFACGLPLHLGMLTVATSAMVAFEIVLFAVMMFSLYPAFLALAGPRRLVVWDDSCSFCSRWVGAFRRADAFGVLRFVGASSPSTYERAGVGRQAAAEAMQLVEPDGTVRGGYDAVQGILWLLPGTYLIAPWMSLPGVRRAGRRLYRRVAARRTCTYEPRAA